MRATRTNLFGCSLHTRVNDEPNSRHETVDIAGAPLSNEHQNDKDLAKAYDRHDSDVTSEEEVYTGEDGTEPNMEERASLRRIGDSMPLATWLVAIVELCERFSYYGCQGLFQNYILKPLDGSLGNGGLGMGSQAATGLNTFFQFFCYGTYCSYIHGASS